MGAIFSSDGGIIAGVLISVFLVLIALFFLAVLTGVVILIVYFIKREDDFVIEEITVPEPKKKSNLPKENEKN